MHQEACCPQTAPYSEADERRFYVLLTEVVEAAILGAIREFERERNEGERDRPSAGSIAGKAPLASRGAALHGAPGGPRMDEGERRCVAC